MSLKSYMFMLSYVVSKWIWIKAWFHLGHSVDSSGLHFVDDSMGLAVVNLTQLVVVFRETTRSDGHWAVQGHSRSQILIPIESSYATTVSYLEPFPSYRGVLVQIIAFDSKCVYLTPSFGVKPWILDWEIWPQNTRNITLSCGAQRIAIYWSV